MELPKNIVDILFFLAPAVLIFFTAFFLIKRFLDNQYKLKLIEAKLMVQKDMMPLRLQAYERLTLFLERISPNNLFARVYQPGFTARDFHIELLSNIRSEFEHNVTQQIYVSSEAWDKVKTAKEEIVKMINTSASAIDPNAKGAELSRTVLEEMMKEETNVSQKAIDFLKSELRQLY